MRRAGSVLAAAAALAAIAVLAVGPGLLPGRTVLPLDILGLFLPWRNTWGLPENPVLGDPVLQFSSRLFIADSLRAGHLPLWNPSVMSGHPMAGDVQAQIFNPILVALSLLLSPLAAFSVQVALDLWLAGLFMYAWMRTLDASRFASLAAALVWMLAGYQQLWLAYPYRLGTLLWWPAVAAAWEYAVLTDRLWLAVAGSVAAAQVLLGGQTQFAFFGAFLIVVYAAGRLYEMGGAVRRRGIAFGVVTAGLGLSMAAVALLPALVQAADTARVPFSLTALRATAVPGRQLITAVAPWFLGDPRLGNWRGEQNANEMALYVGVLPLLLVLVMPFLRRDAKARWALLLAALVAMFALGSPAAWPLAKIPALQLFGLRRWLGVWPLAVALLVGIGLTAPGGPAKKRWRLPAAAVIAASFLASIVVVAALRDPGGRQALSSTLVLLAVSGGALAWWGRRPERRTAQVAVLIAIGADLLLYGHGYTPSASTALAYPRLPPVDWLADQRRAENFRVAVYQGDDIVLGPAVAPSVGLDEIGGYTSSARRSYRDFVAALSTPTSNGFLASNPNMVTIGRARLILLRLLNVRYVLAADPLPEEEVVLVPMPACTQSRQLTRETRIEGAFLATADGLNRIDVAVRTAGSVAVHVVAADNPREHIAFSVLGDDLGSTRTMYFTATEDSAGQEYLVYADAPRDYAGPLPEVCVADSALLFAAWARREPELTQVTAANGIRVYEVPGPLGRGWIAPNGRLVTSQQAALDLVGADGFDVANTVAVEVPLGDAAPPEGAPCDTPPRPARVSVVNDGPNVRLVTLDPPACGWLVLSEAFAPGWRAQADGAPLSVYRADGGIQTVQLVTLAHRVKLTYRPRSLVAGAALTAAGILAGLVLVVMEAWVKKDRRTPNR